MVNLPTGVVSGCASPSVLANVISQQKKASGVENALFAGKIPPRDYAAPHLLKPIDYVLFKTRTMSSLWAHVLLHQTTFIYEAIKKK